MCESVTRKRAGNSISCLTSGQPSWGETGGGRKWAQAVAKLDNGAAPRMESCRWFDVDLPLYLGFGKRNIPQGNKNIDGCWLNPRFSSNSGWISQLHYYNHYHKNHNAMKCMRRMEGRDISHHWDVDCAAWLACSAERTSDREQWTVLTVRCPYALFDTSAVRALRMT